MRLTQLKYFQAVCRYQNMTRAAAELHVSQPSLSNAIHELEDEFGMVLFRRKSRGIALTEQGGDLLQRSRETAGTRGFFLRTDVRAREYKAQRQAGSSLYAFRRCFSQAVRRLLQRVSGKSAGNH